MNTLRLGEDQMPTPADPVRDLFHELVPKGVRTAYLLCGDHGIAEDATSEAFTSVIQRHGEHATAADIKPYFMRAVINTVRSYHRSQAAREQRQIRYGTLRLVTNDPADSASDPALMAALRQLPTKQRTVVVMTYYLDYSDNQICDITTWPIGSIKSLRSRGLKKLQTLLQDKGNRA